MQAFLNLILDLIIQNHREYRVQNGSMQCFKTSTPPGPSDIEVECIGFTPQYVSLEVIKL